MCRRQRHLPTSRRRQQLSKPGIRIFRRVSQMLRSPIGWAQILSRRECLEAMSLSHRRISCKAQPRQHKTQWCRQTPHLHHQLLRKLVLQRLIGEQQYVFFLQNAFSDVLNNCKLPFRISEIFLAHTICADYCVFERPLSFWHKDR
jgi:hypothetical protein